MDLHEALEEIKRDRRRLEAGAREKATAGS
jgi:hypothetical protein